MLMTDVHRGAIEEFLECSGDGERINKYSLESMKNFYYLVMGTYDNHYAFEWAKCSDIFIEDIARNVGGKYNTINMWLVQVNKCNNIAMDAFSVNEDIVQALSDDSDHNYVRDTILCNIADILLSPRISNENKDYFRNIISKYNLVDAFIHYDNFGRLHNEDMFGISEEEAFSFDKRVKERVRAIRSDMVRMAFYNELPDSFDLNILI